MKPVNTVEMLLLAEVRNWTRGPRSQLGRGTSLVHSRLLLLVVVLAVYGILCDPEAIASQTSSSAGTALTETSKTDPTPRPERATPGIADRESALNAALERELALTSERLQYRKRELRWTISIIVLSGVVLVLLTCLLVANSRHRRALLVLADQDGLTGLPNRRRTVEKATTAFAAAVKGGRPLTVALIDLDHFKKINDCCGHAVGDHVLKEFASISRGVLREADTLGRWGGEEFLLVLPDTQMEGAVAILQRLQSAFADVRLPEPERDLRVSFSAGLATRTTLTASLDEMVVCADAALYEAKSGGRNLLRLAPETRRAAQSVSHQALTSGDSRIPLGEG